MSFVSLMTTGRLPEKPWRADAVVRLGASIVVCFMIGGAVTMMFQYFGTPEKTSALFFIALSACALGSFGGGLVLLGRAWSFENYVRKLVWLLVCVYGGFMLMWLAERLISRQA
jgi:hypothetical protein